MPLESLGKDEKLNIKRIETETDLERPFRFDAKNFISPEILVEIHETLQKQEKTPFFVKTAGPLVQLLPQERENLKIPSEMLGLARAKVAQDPYGQQEVLFDSKFLFPNHSAEELGMTGFVWSNLENDMLLEKGNGVSMRFAISASTLAFVASDRRNNLKVEEARPMVDIIRRKIASDGEKGFINFSNDIKAFARLRIVFPSTTKLDIGEKEIELTRSFLGAHRRSWSEFLTYLVDFQIATADTVSITPEGLVITNNPGGDFEDSTPPLPEVKK